MNPIHSRLLLVGSATRSRLHLRALLNELSVTHFDEAADGYAALALHRANPYDLIICEWDLPQLTGVEVLRAIRKGFTRANVSFVLTTGDKLAQRTIEALHAGANGILELPLEPKRVKEKLQRIINSLPEHSGRGAARAADLWSPGP